MKRSVLLIDDEPNDVELVRIALHKINPELHLQHFQHWGEAMDYLNPQGPFADRTKFPLPGMILLDLSMPSFDSFEFLRSMQAEIGYASIPIVVLSGCCNPEEIERVQRAGAKLFLQKTPDLGELTAGLEKCLINGQLHTREPDSK